MNVLVYAGRGVSTESLHSTLSSLRGHVGAFYDVKSVTAEILARDPWELSCSLLVIPGGRDLPYVEDLTGCAIDRIRRWIEGGGRYLGICAGAYFACSNVEFEPNTDLEVKGSRDLALCPATARGAIVPHFEYGSERGARMVSLLSREGKSLEYRSYCNGGCWFDFETCPTTSWKSLFVYAEYSLKPAIIISNIGREGKGKVILSGVHPEYDLKEYIIRYPEVDRSGYNEQWEESREKLWRLILELLGLRLKPITRESQLSLPNPTPLIFASCDPIHHKSFSNLFLPEGGIFTCEATKLKLLCNENLEAGIPSESEYPVYVTAHFKSLSSNVALSFDPAKFFAFLNSNGDTKPTMGKSFLYAEYLPSTQTLLAKNPSLASSLPDGSFVLAGDQLAGKGRGVNTWLSSKGCLQFTMVLRHHEPRSVTLIQYLIGIAMLEAIIAEPGYEWLEDYLHLKWPNDLYSSNGQRDSDGKPLDLKKLGGILVNSQTLGDGFLLLIGFGFNIHDTPWTRSLNEIITSHNQISEHQSAELTKERVLAQFCVTFERLYRQMCLMGFPFDLYYQRWLHTNQVIFLEGEQILTRIEGIDAQGYLIARPHIDGLLGLLNGSAHSHEPNSPSSSAFLLQPDGNSFDMMKGLIKRKV